MAFPMTPLVPTVEMYLGEDLGWVDVTADVRLSNAHTSGGITIGRGRANEGTIADPGSCSLVLNNRAGKYSPRNPQSPYYGLIGRNTPIRVLLDEVDVGTALALPGQTHVSNDPRGPVVTTAYTSDLNVASDLDVRVWARHHNQWREESNHTLAGRWWTGGDERSWYLRVQASGQLTLVWSPDGTFAAARTQVSTVPVDAGPLGDLAVRAVLDVDNGAGQYEVLFYTAPDLGGPWTQLGATKVGTTGATAVAATIADLQVGGEHEISLPTWSGELYGFELRDGIDGPVLAAPNFTDVTDASSVTDPLGRVWTWGEDINVIDRAARIVGEVPVWPARWDLSGNDRWVPIEAAGITRRLGQGASPLRSPLYRTLAATGPAAYLPLEDGDGATRPASVVPQTTGAGRQVEFGQDADGLAGSAAAARFVDAGGYLSTTVASRPAATTWAVLVLVRLAAMPSGGAETYMRVYMSGGTVVRWDLQVSSGNWWWIGYNSVDAVVASQSFTHGEAVPTSWIAMSLQFTQSGGDVLWGPVYHALGTSVYYGGYELFSYTGTVGQVLRVELLGSAYTADALWAHLLVDSKRVPLLDPTFTPTALGHVGEPAGVRLRRLAAEAGVPMVMSGHPVDTTPMGPQGLATLLELWRECAEVDGGILQEARGLLGMSYRTRASLYNRAAVTVDYSAGMISPPFTPVDDDDAIANDITTTRPAGSSARRVLESGPLSVLPPPAGVGTYDISVPLNVATDEQLADQAGWRLRLGTVDEARYPRIRLNLAAAAWRADPGLRETVALLDAGEQVELDGLPAWLPPGPTRAVVQGYTETLDAHAWELTFNATPGSPWVVSVLGDDSRVAADGATLDADITATDTSLSVATIGALFATAPDFPVELLIGGAERVTATAIGAGPSPQTVTLSARSVNGVSRAWAAGTSVDVWTPAVVAL